MFNNIEKVKVPPIKIQGIKTKLVNFINESIEWDGKGVYYEPFMGSGVVGFNLNPEKAIFSDTNPHIIKFYIDLQTGKINSEIVREYLEEEGAKLQKTPEDTSSYYYKVRDRFNKNPNSLDFLFLQRSNFNGMIRFNSSGGYNVPFCRKPDRFRKALVTKIVNQVKWVEDLLKTKKNWEFKCKSFEEIFKLVKEEDFLYLDPPYINRHDGYYDLWSEELAVKLAKLTQESKANYAYSMWYENKYRKNDHIKLWENSKILKYDHFYHVGGKQSNRNAITEALIVK